MAGTVRTVRKFDTGATRDGDTDKPDYEGFLSPLVILEYGKYMHENRVQSNGELRDSDNWQKGIPKEAYIKSLLRHTLDLWLVHRGFTKLAREGIKKVLCAIIFNAQGYLHELLKAEYK